MTSKMQLQLQSRSLVRRKLRRETQRRRSEADEIEKD